MQKFWLWDFLMMLGVPSPPKQKLCKSSFWFLGVLYVCPSWLIWNRPSCVFVRALVILAHLNANENDRLNSAEPSPLLAFFVVLKLLVGFEQAHRTSSHTLAPSCFVLHLKCKPKESSLLKLPVPGSLGGCCIWAYKWTATCWFLINAAFCRTWS